MNSYGRTTAALLLLLARPFTTVCMATAMLVTAGFVFNETFVYWFPNFAFAFILPALITGINLSGPKVTAVAQLIFVGLVILGLLTLVLIAVQTWGTPGIEPSSIETGADWRSIGLAALAFIGYDLLPYTPKKGQQKPNQWPVRAGLLVAIALFSTWNLIAQHFVTAERLIDSHMPHLLTAKAIAGPGGLYIIGIVTLAGACAAVNLLFHSTARMFIPMAHHKLTPSISKQTGRQSMLILCALVAVTCILMVAGFAGTDLLDSAIRAGLIYWIVLYAALQLALFRQRSKKRLHLLIAIGMAATSIALIHQADDREWLLKTLAVIFLLSFIIAVVTVRMASRSSSSAGASKQERR